VAGEGIVIFELLDRMPLEQVEAAVDRQIALHLLEQNAAALVADNKRLRAAVSRVERKITVYLELYDYDDDPALIIVLNELKWALTRELRIND
jgi:hypothetical protein